MAVIIGHWHHAQSGTQYVAWLDATSEPIASPFRARLVQGRTMTILEYLPDLDKAMDSAAFSDTVTLHCKRWRKHLGIIG